MSGVPVRLALFGVLLAAVFGVAAAVGAVVKPGLPASSGEAASMHGMKVAALGLGVSDERYTLSPATFAAPSGRPIALRFRITDVRGGVVRSGFQLEAQRRLHLIVVRRDLRGYQHLHPTEGRDGTWSVPATLPGAGVYRVFADFQIAGQKHVLAGDLTVPGSYAPAALPSPSPTASVDGYRVRLASATLKAGRETDLAFSVSRSGRPIAGLQPYLGALGHLVALRQGDLGYLHIHPHDHAGTGVVPFAATFPSAGSYRLFLQFQTNGTVHTTSFTVKVTP